MRRDLLRYMEGRRIIALGKSLWRYVFFSLKARQDCPSLYGLELIHKNGASIFTSRYLKEKGEMIQG